MKPQAKQTETPSIIKSTALSRVLNVPAEEVAVRELSLEELTQVGGGGIKDHSV